MSAFSKIRFFSSVCLSKAAYKILRLFGRGGTTVPGLLAQRLCPDCLELISKDISTILITGTNGKSTVVRMIDTMLEAEGIDFFSNRSGNNVGYAILTDYILNYKRTKDSKNKLAVIECDEKFLRSVCRQVHPVTILITNVHTDQVDRMGTPQELTDYYKTVLNGYDGRVCLNDGNSYCRQLTDCVRKDRLVSFCCYEGKSVVDGNPLNIQLEIPADYNYENAAAACAALKSCGLLSEKAISSLSHFKLPFARLEQIRIHNTDTVLNLVKNPCCFSATMKYISCCNVPCRIIFGFNANIGDGLDKNWISEIPVNTYRDILNDAAVCGQCAPEMTEQLRSAGCIPVQLSTNQDVFDYINQSDRKVFMLMNYTCMQSFREYLARGGYVNHYYDD